MTKFALWCRSQALIGSWEMRPSEGANQRKVRPLCCDRGLEVTQVARMINGRTYIGVGVDNEWEEAICEDHGDNVVNNPKKIGQWQKATCCTNHNSEDTMPIIERENENMINCQYGSMGETKELKGLKCCWHTSAWAVGNLIGLRTSRWIEWDAVVGHLMRRTSELKMTVFAAKRLCNWRRQQGSEWKSNWGGWWWMNWLRKRGMN